MTAVVVGGLVVLLVFAAAVQGGDPDDGGRDRLAVAEQTSTSSPAAPADTTEPASQETETAEAAPTPTPTQAKPRTYRGAGDKVLKVKETDDVLLAMLTHQGGSNFIVKPIDPGGAEQASIVNAIGGYKGTVLVNEDDGKVLRGFSIKADGAWTITLKPLEMARMWEGARVTGRGDDVLLLSPASSGLTTAKVNHSGSSNFIVHAYAGTSREGLVNEIGSYRGEVLLPDGTLLVTILADGKWTFTRS